ncbi:hypothetical protein HYH02_010867 [Chlamydomonas schloesseri]|uniref:Dehydrogenase E1 component domain-containing protein n=1 Tax=Chlamydomonas schloesseri TaxID=2026947 RepID=A0A835T3S0_9CHLO|nr:hypothetical protein HYH02_010867 [Chlamydomonas schloesseri]|eukprot:KAG2438412.1 hypothetical protein HYH02_010867 [Chlamydomonas schloesseri]
MHLSALGAARHKRGLSELLCALRAHAATQSDVLALLRHASATVAPCQPRSEGAPSRSGLARGYTVSTRSESVAAARSTVDSYLEVPGGRVPYTAELRFLGGPDAPIPTMPCYRTIDSTGQDVPGAHIPHPLSQDLALRMYGAMARLQTMDTMFYEAQRQGRFSFYLTCQGEEATNIGSAAGLANNDMVFAQYREQGVLLWRGYSLDQFANQLLGNALEPGKGRQMPIHYGSPEHAYQTISSPLATQMPHAVGTAYAYKMDRQPRVAVTYFGDGASSEGDAHAAFNFAAVLGAPCLFVCRNNGYAISTPAHEQYKGDGIAGRGPMYGIPSIRVDGGDVRAVYNAVVEARRRALGLGLGGQSGGQQQHPHKGGAGGGLVMEPAAAGGGGGAGQAAAAAAGPGPVLIECMSYRSGHHSTSDDSTRYRTSEEMRAWRARDPVARFRSWLGAQGWWDEVREAELRRSTRQEVLAALDRAAQVPKPPLSDMFTDVYAPMAATAAGGGGAAVAAGSGEGLGLGLLPHLAEQREATLEFARRHPGVCPPDVPLR